MTRAVSFWRANVPYSPTPRRQIAVRRDPHASFAASSRRLQVDVDAVHAAEDIGSYRLSARHFEYVPEKRRGDNQEELRATV